ncbi:translation initiation factor IF-3 [Desulforegula conservatrix]|uniref:translation initiation factor IF-3 n=1 Tax=Desulforegula conservatrix TaxID=153026 RepID=UPI002FBE84AE
MPFIIGDRITVNNNTVSGGVGIAAEQQLRINRNIRAREVRVIDNEGRQLGILQLHEALAAASERALDLVEVSPNVSPPVCKIMDYGKFKYEQTKKNQEAKKKQATFQLKEIKLRPKTGEHDLQTKIRHIKEFLEKKDKVKITVVFRGREITMSEQAKELLTKIAAEITEIATIESDAKFEGRAMVMVVAPKAQ